MSESVAFTAAVDERARAHLVRTDHQEDICFALWYPSRGSSRTTALIYDLVLPLDRDREVHGNAAFNPPYFERALEAAMQRGAGLALMHSHPASGWQGMSCDDVRAERGNAGAVLAATALPLAGLTLAADDGTWSARLWSKSAPRTFDRAECESVRVIGDGLKVSWHPRLRPAPAARDELRRTIEAWGDEAQADLARLHVGVVGLGSVGAIIAEALARIGIQRVSYIDFDRIERHNLDRVLHATSDHVRTRARKVDVAAGASRDAATSAAFDVRALPLSICTDAGYRAALDCDVLFSCVDRPWARSVLNFIAYAHLIPVVDGGIALSRTRSQRMRSGEWRAVVAAPGRACLACLEQYDPGLVDAERNGLLDDPSYIEKLPGDHPLRANQNVFVFALAAAAQELLQFVLLTVGPGGVHNMGAQVFNFPSWSTQRLRDECESYCLYPGMVARGELAGHPGTGRHLAAESAAGIEKDG